MNKKDREEIGKIILSKGYVWSSNDPKYNSGSQHASFSGTGQGISMSGTSYNSIGGVQKKTKQ